MLTLNKVCAVRKRQVKIVVTLYFVSSVSYILQGSQSGVLSKSMQK